MHRAIVIRAKEQATSKWDVAEVIESKPDSVAGMDEVHGSREQIGCKLED